MSKTKLKKYYAQGTNGQIRKIMAASYNEAVEEARKIFGSKYVAVGDKLKHVGEPISPIGDPFGIGEDLLKSIGMK